MDRLSAIFRIALPAVLLWGLWGPPATRPAAARSPATPQLEPAAPRESFTVNSNADDASAHDWLPGDGMCVDSQWRCTLRAAIEEANALVGADTIVFNAAMTIQVDGVEDDLPPIYQQLRIDASGAWNNALDRPGVILDGGDQDIIGLNLRGQNHEIYGLAIQHFITGVVIYSSYNTIGGTGPGQRNVIGGNRASGVGILNPGGHHNVIQNNWIGLDLSGTAAHPNETGVYIASGAYNNLVGGQVWGSGNYISGNTKYGIQINLPNTDNNQVFGNIIGLPASGAADVGNGQNGVYIGNGPQNTQVGSTVDIVAGNYIERNHKEGVVIWSASNNWVENNYIRDNQKDGVYVQNGSGNTLLSNEIAYNEGDGVEVSGPTATGNTLLANRVHHNKLQGIDLFDGGNGELAWPVIAAASSFGAWGTACANCTVHLFSDYENEGEVYEGFANVDAAGKWSYVGLLAGPNVTATVTDAGGSTSEFSAPKNIYAVYMPVVRKK